MTAARVTEEHNGDSLFPLNSPTLVSSSGDERITQGECTTMQPEQLQTANIDTTSHFSLTTLLASNPPDQRTCRDLFKACPWLRQKKRQHIVEFFQGSEFWCAVAKGPPGSLKTACSQWAAKEANFVTADVVIDGQWSAEKMKNVLDRAMAQSAFDGPVRGKAVMVYNGDVEIQNENNT